MGVAEVEAKKRSMQLKATITIQEDYAITTRHLSTEDLNARGANARLFIRLQNHKRISIVYRFLRQKAKERGRTRAEVAVHRVAPVAQVPVVHIAAVSRVVQAEDHLATVQPCHLMSMQLDRLGETGNAVVLLFASMDYLARSRRVENVLLSTMTCRTTVHTFRQEKRIQYTEEG